MPNIAQWVTPKKGMLIQREFATPEAAEAQAFFAASIGCKAVKAWFTSDTDPGVVTTLYPVTIIRSVN